MHKFDIDLDLTAVFSLKNCPTCRSDLSPIEQIRKKIIEVRKHFKYSKFKTRLMFIKSDYFKFIKIINKYSKKQTTEIYFKGIYKI